MLVYHGVYQRVHWDIHRTLVDFSVNHAVFPGTLIYKFIKEIAFAREENVRTEWQFSWPEEMPVGEL